MPTAPRVVIEQVPNDLIRIFHVNERISSETLYDSLPGVDNLGRFGVRDHNPSTIQTALSFYDIEGVTSVSLDIYQVRVTISRAFDWEDIEPLVVDLVRKHLKWDDCEVRGHDSRPMYGGSPSVGGFGDFDLHEASDFEK